MAWFVRFTRFGQAHMCYAQEQSDSCGIASGIMVNFKLKAGAVGAGTIVGALFPSLGALTGKLLGGDANSTAVKAEQEVYKLVGAGYTGKTGTTGTQVANILTKLKLGTWRGLDTCDSKIIGTQILICYRNGWPTIIGNSWYTSATHKKLAGGGHWVVVDTVNKFSGKLYASICDPLTGNVHVTEFTPGQDFLYDPSNAIGWEAPLDDYKFYADGYKSKGYSRMDGMVYCTSSGLKMVGMGGTFAA